jgi:Nucleotidyl transferase AbiEii toxin, Type IV TA system
MDKEKYLPIKILHDFTARMENLGVNYMLTGSMAMMYYAVYRFTADVDVVLEINPADVTKVIEILEPDYYVPHDSARRAASDKKMFNVIHIETAFKIDCIIKKTTDFQKNVFERRLRADFYGREIRIISKEDLIISKLWWAKDSRSEKQLTDVKNLMRNDFDAAYIENWTQKLDVFDLFEKCRKEIEE